jgi:hypothetical protein
MKRPVFVIIGKHSWMYRNKTEICLTSVSPNTTLAPRQEIVMWIHKFICLIEYLEGMIPLGKPRRKGKDNIKTGFKVGCYCVRCIQLI